MEKRHYTVFALIPMYFSVCSMGSARTSFAVNGTVLNAEVIFVSSSIGSFVHSSSDDIVHGKLELLLGGSDEESIGFDPTTVEKSAKLAICCCVCIAETSSKGGKLAHPVREPEFEWVCCQEIVMSHTCRRWCVPQHSLPLP